MQPPCRNTHVMAARRAYSLPFWHTVPCLLCMFLKTLRWRSSAAYSVTVALTLHCCLMFLMGTAIHTSPTVLVMIESADSAVLVLGLPRLGLSLSVWCAEVVKPLSQPQRLLHVAAFKVECNFHTLAAGVVHAAMGQSQSQNSEHLRLAQQCFQAVGSSPAECDTIPGEPACNWCVTTHCLCNPCFPILLPSLAHSYSPLTPGPCLRCLLVHEPAVHLCLWLSS